jgi:dynein heavy chain, axonemal
VYQRIISELRATPTKFHYTFNLRDVSKVFQGILMTKPVSVSTETTFTKLWVNETLRVFHDRLVTEDDVQWFTDLVMELTTGMFKSAVTKDELFGDNKVMFGDLLKLEVNRNYEEIL